MRILQKLRFACRRVMYGRNGMDQLNYALFPIYLILYAIQFVATRIFFAVVVARVTDVCSFALALVILFRIFSRDLLRRQAENRKWLSLRWRVRERTYGIQARRADKTHKYFVCRRCKALCRVPAGKGCIIATCPRCGTERKTRS